jgi:hypothetical protein
MATPSSRCASDPGADQVWSELEAQRRQQAISVVAQMAFHFVKTQSEYVHREEDYAHALHTCQAPQ